MATVLAKEKVMMAYLKGHSLFNKLDESALNEICSVASLIKLRKRSLFLINDSRPKKVFFIVAGVAKLMKHDKNGSSFVKNILVDGSVFGDLSFGVSEVDSDSYVIALKPVTCIVSIVSSEFRKILQRYPQLAASYAEAIGISHKQLETRHYIWTNYDARERLLFFLKGWSNCAGVKDGQHVVLENYFSLTDISEFIGVSRQFLHIMLKELKKEGLVSYTRKKIIIATVFLQQEHETKQTSILKVVA